tara:strand:+ start:186 stop:404 length:219 start_codon:yes stop_codon:yes gene_type:complete
MKLILTEIKNVYGNDLEYIKHPKDAAEHFEQLTGKKTINESDKEALEKLGDIRFYKHTSAWQRAMDYDQKGE